VKFQAALDKWDIDPRFVKVEITESSIMADRARARDHVDAAVMGIRPSLDDWHRLPRRSRICVSLIDELKIDKSRL
jgi:predicted signal transduction protein with EAL and GGDEF domain